MRFNRSRANILFVSVPAAQSPLSWASESDTMCSISVSPVLEKHRPEYGP